MFFKCLHQVQISVSLTNYTQNIYDINLNEVGKSGPLQDINGNNLNAIPLLATDINNNII